MTVGVSRENRLSRVQRVPVFPMDEEEITPSDTVEFKVPVIVECTVAGDVAYEPFDAEPGRADLPLTKTMAVGDTLQVCVRKVLETGTDATVNGIW